MRGFRKVAILGGGEFGVALAKQAAIKSKGVVLWARDPDVCSRINSDRRHPHKLSQITLPENVVASSDLKSSVVDCSVAIVAVPMASLSQVVTPLGGLLKKDAIVVSTAKGIEEDTLCLPHEVLKRCLPGPLADRACFLSGPSFAIELALALPTALSLASQDQEVARIFQMQFSSEHCRLYRSSDVIGVGVGGALKNVIAIAAGACRSLALGRNALAALITRGLNEIRRLAVCWGAEDETLSGLCGMGDLILSCTDELSRNHRLGFFIGQGMDIKTAHRKIGGVVEGARTAKAIPHLLSRYDIEMPISQAVHDVLYNGLMVDDALSSLMSRKLDDELH